MKYLIEKSGKLHSQILIEDVAFDADLFKLIETDFEPTFIVNKWDGKKWIETATAEQIAEFNKPQESESLLEQFNQFLASIGKSPLVMGLLLLLSSCTPNPITCNEKCGKLIDTRHFRELKQIRYSFVTECQDTITDVVDLNEQQLSNDNGVTYYVEYFNFDNKFCR